MHHHLIRKGLRTSVGLVVETGEAREVHHFACLAGYGAEAINPYLAFETLPAMAKDLPEEIDGYEAVKRFIKSIDKGLLKVMSKMGISTYQSYCGAQIFDAVGLSQRFVDEFFFGTATTIEGAGLAEIARGDRSAAIADAFGDSPVCATRSTSAANTPTACAAKRIPGRRRRCRCCSTPCAATRATTIDAFAKLLNEQTDAAPDHPRPVPHQDGARRTAARPCRSTRSSRPPTIVKRFSTGAMSYGSISREAHTTLAIAMNRIGGKSNTGEGGEESDRYKRMANGDSMRSAIKQVASGPLRRDGGISRQFRHDADQDGAGRKARRRRTIARPQGRCGDRQGAPFDAGRRPHLAAAASRHLFDRGSEAARLRPEERQSRRPHVSVKLVSEVGVGTVAAGVAKCKADHVTISGYEGGTGASPLTSIKHAGSPWEIGLAETHQTLVMNGLRSRIAVQVDGGVRTGRDVVIGALLGADEFGFATAPLIAAGCIMMRKCHLNTCPVGVATQDPVLRKRFVGKPEHVINYLLLRRRGSARDDGAARLPQRSTR